MPEPEYIDDRVQLSNKACPRHYGKFVDGEWVGRKTGRCSCPEGRCWYDENIARRRQGLQAIEFTWNEEKP